jgi:predicted ABC-type sugar transport system permease subunit
VAVLGGTSTVRWLGTVTSTIAGTLMIGLINNGWC